jgi:predicted metalloprotease with PDZ domain
MILRMPLWRPGAYRYSNYQRKVSSLEVVDQDGVSRPLQRLDDRSWQFQANGATSIRVDYDLEVRNDADSGAAPAFFVHGPATFLTVEGTELLPHFLHTKLPENWDFASGHRPYPNEPGTWYSPNYDVFVDCPMAFGAMERYSFELHERPFEIALLGKLPTEEEFDREVWVEKVRKISAASFDVVGDFPFERYVYLYIFNDIGGYSGLEHLNSTSIEVSHRMVKRGMVEPLESVTAHEFFHLWNVKRIRPSVLGPFDYSKDAHTNDLWWMEGVTSYYNDVILQRSGLRSGQEGWFLGSQLQNRGNLENSQGYGRVSPEQASWRVWGSNSNVSYYDLGQSLGWLLDIQIRHHTQNKRSLDDVVRALNRWVDYPGKGLNEGDIERMIKAVTGWDCSEFFDLYVSGNNAFPFAEVLPLSGLKVTQALAGDPYLGIRLDDNLIITAATNEFRVGDKLISIDGSAIDNLTVLRALIPQLQAGSSISLVMENSGEQRTILWTVKEREKHAFRVQPMAEMEPLQRAIFDGILSGTPNGI